LPSDPRGRCSQTVGNDIIAELGELHRGRRRAQPPSPVIREFYARADGVLKYPLLEFSSSEIRTIADKFAQAMGQYRYTCYACAIMPDHVHLLIRKHRDKGEQMIESLQEFTRLRFSGSPQRGPNHPLWAKSGWKVFFIGTIPTTSDGQFATSARTRPNAECPNKTGRLSQNTTVGPYTQATIPTHHTQNNCKTPSARAIPNN
jgi:REP element-mobilizing transposase RayT